eukprot:24722-Eustigmatos_ZCMA.PRE.1
MTEIPYAGSCGVRLNLGPPQLYGARVSRQPGHTDRPLLAKAVKHAPLSHLTCLGVIQKGRLKSSGTVKIRWGCPVDTMRGGLG